MQCLVRDNIHPKSERNGRYIIMVDFDGHLSLRLMLSIVRKPNPLNYLDVVARTCDASAVPFAII